MIDVSSHFRLRFFPNWVGSCLHSFFFLVLLSQLITTTSYAQAGGVSLEITVEREVLIIGDTARFLFTTQNQGAGRYGFIQINGPHPWFETIKTDSIEGSKGFLAGAYGTGKVGSLIFTYLITNQHGYTVNGGSAAFEVFDSITIFTIGPAPNFSETIIGDTICKDLIITNLQKTPQRVTSVRLLNGREFKIGDIGTFPISVAPHANANISICYSPISTAHIDSLEIGYFNKEGISKFDTVKISGNVKPAVFVSALSHERISLWPNPARDYIQVDVPNPNVTGTLSDMMGRTVLQTTLKSTHTVLNLAPVPTGNYFLRLSPASPAGESATLPLLIRK
jgi:hypothetical protein